MNWKADDSQSCIQSCVLSCCLNVGKENTLNSDQEPNTIKKLKTQNSGKFESIEKMV